MATVITPESGAAFYRTLVALRPTSLVHLSQGGADYLSAKAEDGTDLAWFRFAVAYSSAAATAVEGLNSRVKSATFTTPTDTSGPEFAAFYDTYLTSGSIVPLLLIAAGVGLLLAIV